MLQIGQSGFGGVLGRFPGGHNATDGQQDVYNKIVNGTSCASAASSLDCLRELPLDEFHAVLNGTQQLNFPPILDGDFIADYPSRQIADGRHPKIPILIGNNADEGTSFGTGRGPADKGGRVETDADFAYVVESVIGPDQQSGRSVDELVREASYAYPDIQAVGVPSLDKWPAIVPGDQIASLFGMQWRRAAAFLGD
jgi:carboxylesterase type B